MQPQQPHNQKQNNTKLNQTENQSNQSSTGTKVAVGTILLALIGLLGIFIENGGLDFIRPLILGSNNTASQPTTQNNSPPIPSNSAPSGDLPSSPIGSDSTPSGNLPSAPSSESAPATQQPATSQAPTPQPNTVSTQSAAGFSFENTGCVRRGTDILCTFLITSLEEDKRLQLYGNSVSNSRVIDSSGNEFVAQNVKLGSNESRSFVTANLVQGIPLKAVLVFPGVPSEVNQLPLLELALWSGDTSKVQFRDVVVFASQ